MENGPVEAYEQNNERYDIIDIDETEQIRDDVTIFIEEKLEKMPPIIPECSIYRVPKLLMEMNEMAYVPQVISIGPFHHDQTVLKATEELKLRLFNSYRCRVDMDIQGIVEMVRKWEKRARRYYSEFIDMSSDEFVKMMVLDGCFIVELLITDYGNFPKTENMVISSIYDAIYFSICGDLMKLQNQLPFFVLEGLFDQVSQSPENSVSFERVVRVFLSTRVLTCSYVQQPSNLWNIKPRHLLDFLSFYFVPLEGENYVHQRTYLPPTATELSEAGVVLKKAEEKHIMDISFENGVLKIPPFEINDCFETNVRNLLAFEEFTMENFAEQSDEVPHMASNKKYAIHYFLFLDELITTKQDVRLLVKEGIIINSIGGSDKEISKLFNDLCKNATLHGYNFFSHISKDLRDHCKRRRNRWMASLKHNYFNTPWAFISFLAATFLILLTLLQTISSLVTIFK